MNAVEYILSKHMPHDYLESQDILLFSKFVTEYGNRIYDRTPGAPTITASAIVVNPDFSKILVMHHKLHGFYKQFGGHADGNSKLDDVAATELFQESGAHGTFLSHMPIDLIRWNFPDRNKNGIFYPAHDCFDIGFLFMMDDKVKPNPNKREVLDTKWESLKKWRNYSDMENPVYRDNPQNINYQHRIYEKILLTKQQFTFHKGI